MDFVIEIIMEALIEGFFGGLAYLAEAFVPEKHLSKKARKIICGCLAVLACVLGLGLIVGVVLLLVSEGESSWGWGLVSAAIVYVVLGIVLKIVSKGKKEKRGPEL